MQICEMLLHGGVEASPSVQPNEEMLAWWKWDLLAIGCDRVEP